ncbi:hypothetical protein [Sneathiella limimaris]|uniref:hypothetical protein n=1 Tax=Sneathiella limimaris TaxID=1964213 RepID=UPI00146EC8D7|nr:hypothetical protein [Sneathiella limimaris]
MYSFDSPSPRYRQLLDYYRVMHSDGVWRRKDGDVVKFTPLETFSGRGVFKHAKTIRKLSRATEAETLLDFGSGKGRQYTDEVFQNGQLVADNLCDYWQLKQVTCYDPALNDQDQALSKTYDGVIATNVLDLIPEEDLYWVTESLFQAADKFVFCNVLDYSSQTYLPSGENARVTRRSSIWWRGMFAAANAKKPHVKYCIAYGSQGRDRDGKVIRKTGYLHNCQDLRLSSEAQLSPAQD